MDQLKRQMKEAIEKTVHAIKAKKERYSLMKLPMFGRYGDQNKIDFEWPTQDIFGKMQAADLSMKSIRFEKLKEYASFSSV